MPVEVVLAILKELPWKTILKITIIFSLFFSVLMTYFNMSALTSIWTSLLVSFLFSAGMTIGIHLSLHFRIAAANSVVQMFSQFGLFMLFSFTSWVTMQDTLENFVQVQNDLHSQACAKSEVNETSEVSSDFERLESMIVILHYSNATPFLLIFVYSFLYELTFEVRKEKKSKNENKEGSSLLTNVLILGRHLMSFFVGIIFSFTLALFIFKRFFFHAVLSAISSSACRDSVQNRQSAVFFTFYLVFCGIFVVLLPFSRLIPKLRASIIKKFIPVDGNGGAQQQPAHQEAIAARVQLQPTLAQSIVATFQQQSAKPQGNIATVQRQPAVVPSDTESVQQRPIPNQSNIANNQQQPALHHTIIEDIPQHPDHSNSTAEPNRAADTSIDFDFD